MFGAWQNWSWDQQDWQDWRNRAWQIEANLDEGQENWKSQQPEEWKHHGGTNSGQQKAKSCQHRRYTDWGQEDWKSWQHMEWRHFASSNSGQQCEESWQHRAWRHRTHSHTLSVNGLKLKQMTDAIITCGKTRNLREALHLFANMLPSQRDQVIALMHWCDALWTETGEVVLGMLTALRVRKNSKEHHRKRIQIFWH